MNDPDTHTTDPKPLTTNKPAIFLDRDGTIIEAVHYLSDPAGVRLLPGAAAIRDLRAAGFACVVVTNQSAVGRGMFALENSLYTTRIKIWGFFLQITGVGDTQSVIAHHERSKSNSKFTQRGYHMSILIF